MATKNGEEVSWMPPANISETPKEYLIKAELPEMKKEDVSITLQNGVITIGKSVPAAGWRKVWRKMP